jgi:HEPN domain-containing protein
MRRKESLYSKDWFRIGDKELKRAENLLKLKDLTGAGFNLHQAVEKYLKGFLLSRGWELRRIHELEVLLNEAIIYEPSFEQFREVCIFITDFYTEDRYPFINSSEPNSSEIQSAFKAAKQMIRLIKKLAGFSK